MRLIINYLFWCLLTPLIACSQKVDDRLKYLEQKPPSLSPEIFAPGLISKNTESEFVQFSIRKQRLFSMG